MPADNQTDHHNRFLIASASGARRLSVSYHYLDPRFTCACRRCYAAALTLSGGRCPNKWRTWRAQRSTEKSPFIIWNFSIIVHHSPRYPRMRAVSVRSREASWQSICSYDSMICSMTMSMVSSKAIALNFMPCSECNTAVHWLLVNSLSNQTHGTKCKQPVWK